MSSSTKCKVSSELKERIERIQSMLVEQGIDSWLFYYFKNNDPISLSILGRDEKAHFSRRWFYLIPAKGEPVKVVHRIEMEGLDDLPGEKRVYLGWQQLEQELEAALSRVNTVAMQYSAGAAVPYVARVDAGTIEMVRGLGKSVVSSQDLVQAFEARWSDAQLESHKYAAEKLRTIVDETFARVAELTTKKATFTEYDIQCFMMDLFARDGLTTYSPPIVAINANSASPHYQPTKDVHLQMKEGDFLLIDLWAKRKDDPLAIYGDITWTGFIGKEVPDKHVRIFEIVRDARDEALKFIKSSLAEGREIYGREVDDVTRNFIAERGFGDQFVHRTGHSIGTEVHGNGANIDNLETREERRLIPGTGFSIEPGIYLDGDFGVRSEIDAYLSDSSVEVFGQPIQTAVVPILSLD